MFIVLEIKYARKTVVLQLAPQNHRLAWAGKDTEGSWSPALQWTAHMGIKPAALHHALTNRASLRASAHQRTEAAAFNPHF